MDQYIDVVFDGPPSNQGGRFVEVENEAGESINAGEWIPPAKEAGLWRLRLKVKPGLNNLARIIHETASSHGFWPTDKGEALEALKRIEVTWAGTEELEILRRYIEAQEIRNMGEMLMLAVSELAEGLEEHRDGRPVHYYTAKLDGDTHSVFELDGDYFFEGTTIRVPKGSKFKPEGLAVELIDCVIRCLDTLHSLGVDIDELAHEKMAYNSGRPHKHGKAY